MVMFEQIPKFGDFPQGSPEGPWAGLKSGQGHRKHSVKIQGKGGQLMSR